ncbi:sigma-70 family RNA polymerase sigma factor [Sphingomonas baiyangensis]|uniref:Sigma-70 family RNA polymerase sigma factor n=2 Tax=Sphingomonas baiyangensis TaxID=2572576 RepID=A0A4U1L8Q7_9SPHN|nr:sigma-70 family RNA polymerase sigma factor [Sphingomonas baiyangensis]
MFGDRPLGELMARAQAGDAHAYRTLLEQSGRWLRRYFGGRIAPHLIDDLVQDTLASVHAKRATFDPARPYLPWLAAIARYRWVDQLRRGYRADETLLRDDLAADPIDAAETARISLDALLAYLPDRQVMVIRLVKIDGLSVAEASARTGQSEALVKVNVHRGLKRLAALVEKA